jgi:hypothetical protein
MQASPPTQDEDQAQNDEDEDQEDEPPQEDDNDQGGDEDNENKMIKKFRVKFNEITPSTPYLVTFIRG